MANATDNILVDGIGQDGRRFHLPVDGGSTIYEGTLVAQLVATGMLVAATTSGAGPAIGKATHKSDNSAGADGAKRCLIETDRVYRLTNGSSTNAFTEAHAIGSVAYASDDHTVYNNDAGGTLKRAGLFDGLEADGKVRVLVSSAERANSYGYLPIPLTAFREVTSAGAVGAIAAIGGVLASDTTPVLGAAATSEAMQIVWAAGNADIIQASISLPGDFSGAFDVLLELQVLTDNAGGGGIEAATFTVNSSFDNGAQVVDTATDGTPAVTVHKVTATIAAADVADAPSFVNIQLVPGTHANDPIHLLAARLVFRRAST